MGLAPFSYSLCLSVFPGQGWLQLYPRVGRARPGVSHQGASLFLVRQAPNTDTNPPTHTAQLGHLYNPTNSPSTVQLSF